MTETPYTTNSIAVQETAFDDQSHAVQKYDFPYDEVDARLGHEEVSAQDITAAVHVLRRIIQWMWQDGMQDERGLEIRSIIVAWVFLSEVSIMTETDLGRKMGFDKQSLDRWFGPFKEAFPEIKTPHMQ